MTMEPVVRKSLPVPHIALVELNRPNARNAINSEVADALHEAVIHYEADDDVWVVVLTGTGNIFCAGADLAQVARGEGDKLLNRPGGFGGLAFADRQKPWIAAVNGAALAGGTELALSCDLIVAAENAYFGLPEVRLGLIAAAGGVHRLMRALPRARAMELIATGGKLSAGDALVAGLVNRVVPQDACVGEAIKLASEICENAPVSVRESLSIARRAYDLDDRALADLAMSARERLRRTDDYAEGPRAFLEKRAPQWKGR
jgi:enoyl-CoA hydratase/carnithine racemase